MATLPRRSPAAWVGAAVLAVLAVVLGLARARRPGGRRAAVPADPPPEGSRTVRTDDGVTLHVEVDEPAATAEVTVVFVHGFTARLREFELQRAALAAAGGVRAVLYDQRGHGRSARGSAGRSTIDQLARDLAVVLAEVPPGPVVLLGHSLGGMTVMALARQRPELFGDRIAGVFLLATSAGELVTTGPLGRAVRLLRRLHLLRLYLLALRLGAPLLERGRLRGTALARRFYRHYLFGTTDADPLLVPLVQELLEETPFTVTAAFYPTFLTHDETDALPALRDVAVTICVGSDDRLTPAAHSVRMARIIGGSCRLIIIDGAGHSVNITRPEVVDRALLDLLERVRVRQPSVRANSDTTFPQARSAAEGS